MVTKATVFHPDPLPPVSPYDPIIIVSQVVLAAVLVRRMRAAWAWWKEWGV